MPGQFGRGQVIPDPRLVVGDRGLWCLQAHIIETGSESYRLRTIKAKNRPRK
jgi:hypothetical protein